MNGVMERLYPDGDAVARRRAQPFPRLVPATDMFTAYLHEEMRQCYLNGHDHAALVSGCALVESAVKAAIYWDEYVKTGGVFDRAVWDKIDKREFGNAIGLAKRRGVVSKDLHKKLDWVRKHIRNVYMHGETPPWLKNEQLDDVVVANMKTGKARQEDVCLGDNFELQRVMRLKADRDTCQEVIPLIDRVVRTIVNGSVEKLQRWRDADPFKPSRRHVVQMLDAMKRMGADADTILMSEIPDDLMAGDEQTRGKEDDQADKVGDAGAETPSEMILDHIDGITLTDELAKKHFNELQSRRHLSQGLAFLYQQVKAIEAKAVQQINNQEHLSRMPPEVREAFAGKDVRYFSGGNDPMLAWLPKGLITCFFHWYAVSLCNYVRLIGHLSKQTDPEGPSPAAYVESVVPEVKWFRDKVAAHFARAANSTHDCEADQDLSVMYAISFLDGRFFAGGWILTKWSKDERSEAGCEGWSLTQTHEQLAQRYGGRGKGETSSSG